MFGKLREKRRINKAFKKAKVMFNYLHLPITDIAKQYGAVDCGNALSKFDDSNSLSIGGETCIMMIY